MAGKERSIEIVDEVGTRVMLFDGDRGMISVNDGIIHDEMCLTWPLVAAAVNSYIWTNRMGVWVVTGVSSIISVSGGTSAAVQLRVCSGVTAILSGVAQLDPVLDVQETAPNKQVGVLIATPTLIFPGDSLAIEFVSGGTFTGLVGALTVCLKRTN